MKRFYTMLLSLAFALTMSAQGWPEQYNGVMLQAFYWDSFEDTNWNVLRVQADELSQYFDLVWIPQSANCGGTSMGYDDLYWFTNYNSSFGTKDDLLSLISTFNQKGIGTIADVVINHRKTLTGKNFDFPSETYKGVTYSMTKADVVKGDGGTGAADTGEGWDGMPDLDHTSQNVQNTVKAYLKMLLEDLGYAGFRYDMVKGYNGSYTAMYNNYAKPQFSVGECWDGTNTIKNWIDATGKTSAAFDFQFRYTVRNAAHSGDWSYLAKQNDGNWPLVSSSTNSGSYRRWAVTFVENHDTERRKNAEQDPLKKDTLAANAYMLAMPGTPCVFLTHWMDCKQAIKAMIDIRKMAGLHNESATNVMGTSTDRYVVRTTGTNGQILAAIGKTASSYERSGFTRVLSGYHYAYFLNNEMNVACVDLASGEYNEAQKVTLTAVSTDASARLVYTTDGSQPTASSKQVASGTRIDIPMNTTMTLKVGLLSGGKVTAVITRNYVVKPAGQETVVVPSFCTRTADEVCAFFEAPIAWSQSICCWAWSNTPSENFTYAEKKGWPGTTCTYLGDADNGNKVWKWTWDGVKQNNSAAKQPQFIIFSNNGSPQTDDMAFTNGGYYNRNGLQGTVNATGIESIMANEPAKSVIYDLQGRRMNEGSALRPGIYIINNKKVVIK